MNEKVVGVVLLYFVLMGLFWLIFIVFFAGISDFIGDKTKPNHIRGVHITHWTSAASIVWPLALAPLLVVSGALILLLLFGSAFRIFTKKKENTDESAN